MKHKFECPHCGQRISATPDLFGRRRTCPACAKEFTVPSPEGYEPIEPSTRKGKSSGSAEDRWREERTIPVRAKARSCPSFPLVPVVAFIVVGLLLGVVGLQFAVVYRLDHGELALWYADMPARLGERSVAGSGDAQDRLAEMQRQIDDQKSELLSLKSRVARAQR